MKILITGATGFIGSALCCYFQKAGFQITVLVRSESQIKFPQLRLNDLSQILATHLDGFDVVIHTAGIAHQNNITEGQFQEVNTQAAITLANACVEAKVPRLITLSSTKAVGEGNVGPSTKAAPMTPYGRSKRDAERALDDIQSHSNIEILQLRIPLTFGPGVKGNFPSLIKLAAKGLPLPYSSLKAKRHYLYIENLKNFIAHCVGSDVLPQSEKGGSCLFLADEKAISLGDVLKTLTSAQDKKVRNVPVPTGLVKLVSKLLPHKTQQKLFEDSLVDVTETYRQAKWQPKYTSIEGINQMFGKSS